MTDQYPRYRALTQERAEQLVKLPERQQLLAQIRRASTSSEVEAAKRAYREWMIRNPDDFGVLMAAEQLADAEEALSQPRRPTGRAGRPRRERDRGVARRSPRARPGQR